jgi:hypothetical protein
MVQIPGVGRMIGSGVAMTTREKRSHPMSVWHAVFAVGLGPKEREGVVRAIVLKDHR